jgi:DNA transposition AAA+ family ATPase
MYPPVDVSANPMYLPMQMMDNQSYETGLSQGAILKIQELKRLVNKYPQFHTIDADEIVKWAIYCSSNRDNKFLDDMMQQLRTIDSLAKY